MPSSGSFVVRYCICIPGHSTTFTSGLSGWLPADAAATTTISGSAAGVPASLTTYSDPNYVTISAYGQNIDLAVPASAQQYLPMLACAAA